MKIGWWLVVVAVVLGLGSWGLRQKRSSVSVLEWDSVEADCGLLPPKDDGRCRFEHRFVVTNHSRRPVRFLNLEMSCSCIDANCETAILPPGSSTGIRVFGEFHAEELLKEEAVIVQTDCPTAELTRLSIRASSEGGIQMTPTNVDFGTVPWGQTVTRTVHIFWQHGRVESPGKATVESENSGLSWQIADPISELQHSKGGPPCYREHWKVTFSYTNQGSEKTRYFSPIILFSLGDTQRKLSPTMTAMDGKEFTIEPKFLHWGLVERGHTKVITVTVTSENPSAHLSGCRISGDSFRLTKSSEGGSSISADVEFVGQTVGHVQGELRIDLNGEKELRLPLTAICQ